MQVKYAKITKRIINKSSEDMNGKLGKKSFSTTTETKDNSYEKDITINEFYEPTELPDYRGEIFQYVDVKLQQLDIQNVENNLKISTLNLGVALWS
jgi:hypothetical protein